MAAIARACIATGPGGDNLLRLASGTFCFGEPDTQGNGTVKGRLYRFRQGEPGTTAALVDIGYWKVSRDGELLGVPMYAGLREALEMALRSPVRAVEFGDDTGETPMI